MSLVYKGSGSEESNFLAQYSINEEELPNRISKRTSGVSKTFSKQERKILENIEKKLRS
jgi:hypothetical protein